MKCGSLFTGIRGLDIAVEALGFPVVWHAEIDPDASKELERQRPGIPNHGDVTKIDYSKVEPVEVLSGGGWPCQPFSQAGEGLGTEDPRYLWPEVARALRSLRPKVFFMEQVTDVLNERKYPGVFGRCLTDLAEAGLHARWGCLRNSDVGAPHGRNRLFLAAYAPSYQGRVIDGDRIQAAANRARSRFQGHGQDDDGERSPTSGGGSDPAGRGSEVDGSANGGGRAAAYSTSERRQGTPSAGGGVEPEQLAGDFDWREWEPAIRRWEAIVGPAPMPGLWTSYRGKTSLKLNHGFSAWMMGLETPHLSRRSSLRCIGNAVNPLAAFVALKQLCEA